MTSNRFGPSVPGRSYHKIVKGPLVPAGRLGHAEALVATGNGECVEIDCPIEHIYQDGVLNRADWRCPGAGVVPEYVTHPARYEHGSLTLAQRLLLIFLLHQQQDHNSLIRLREYDLHKRVGLPRRAVGTALWGLERKQLVRRQHPPDTDELTTMLYNPDHVLLLKPKRRAARASRQNPETKS